MTNEMMATPEQTSKPADGESELNAGLGCDCIENLHKQLHDKIHSNFAKPNKPVQYFNIRQTMSGRAIVNIIVDLAKQMKPVETFIVAEYCPWCGKKYEV